MRRVLFTVAETRDVTGNWVCVVTPVHACIHACSPPLSPSHLPDSPLSPTLSPSVAPVRSGGCRGLGATAAAGGQVSAGGSEFSVESNAGGASLTVIAHCTYDTSYIKVINTNQLIGCRWVSDEVRQTPPPPWNSWWTCLCPSQHVRKYRPAESWFCFSFVWISFPSLFISLTLGGWGSGLGAGKGADRDVSLWCLIPSPHVCVKGCFPPVAMLQQTFV